MYGPRAAAGSVPLLLCLLIVGAFCSSAIDKEQERLERIREKVSSLVDPLREAEEALAARFIAPESGSDDNKSLFSLIPGRYPKAVSLPEFLESLPTLPGGPEALQIVIELIQSKTGINIPEDTLKLILSDSSLLLNYFKGSPRLLHQLWAGLNYVMPPSNQTAFRVPSGFNFPDELTTFAFNVTPYLPSISPLTPNSSVWFGFFMPETTTLEQAKINFLTSFILNQLSDNHHLKPTDPNWFVVKVKGQSYSRIDTFFNALLADNQASLNTYLTKRIAAFYGLYMQDKQGNLLEVADPVMIQTGLFDPTGKNEVVLPAIHSEYVIEFGAGNFNFNVVWYEGDDGIGFFPGNMWLLESWVGTLNGPNITGSQGVNAILYMSALRDILIQTAVKNELWDDGYGVSGVCDDSCGIIEMVTTGSSTEYPNLMDKSFVVPEILYRVRQRDDLSYLYYDLLKIVNNMPVDWRGTKDPTARSRAAGTIVWPVGAEPFQCVIDARAILNAYDWPTAQSV